jgi:hypothetical protein
MMMMMMIIIIIIKGIYLKFSGDFLGGRIPPVTLLLACEESPKKEHMILTNQRAL